EVRKREQDDDRRAVILLPSILHTNPLLATYRVALRYLANDVSSLTLDALQRAVQKAHAHLHPSVRIPFVIATYPGNVRGHLLDKDGVVFSLSQGLLVQS
ncbi:MAG: hypothetical protein ACD_81C00175G0001, partial [uncultured bacterium]